eukprot:CAMPEP_0179022062 /NCGR_PEP_ID=MMETSP0796-20121207/6212_1 /TAXON_ID=73915 /ORGANISM="Pyrodinium bahamense, Strain pbaha01" /LENGTH=229 /DNA_ID=CAMNT_0020717913 /DNA_START=62 /DNA_END=748 /DNA_ORIENTATION=-
MDAIRSEAPGQAKSKNEDDEEEDKGTVVVSDMRVNSTKSGQRMTGRRPSKDERTMGSAASSSTKAPWEEAPATATAEAMPPKDDVVKQVRDLQLKEAGDRQSTDDKAASSASDLRVEAPSKTWGGAARQPSAEPPSPTSGGRGPPRAQRAQGEEGSKPADDAAGQPPRSPHSRPAPITDALVAGQMDADVDEVDGAPRRAKKINTMKHTGNVESFSKLNQIIFTRSKRA